MTGLNKSVRGPGLMLVLAALALTIAPKSHGSVETLAKFSPLEDKASLRDDPHVSGSRAWVLRWTAPKRAAIVRLQRGREPVTVARMPLTEFALPWAEWLSSPRAVVAIYSEVEDLVEGSDPVTYRTSVLAGLKNRRLQRIPGRVFGPVAVDDTRVAVVVPARGKLKRLAIYDVAGSRPRLVSRKVIPGPISKKERRIDPLLPGWPWAVSISGTDALIATPKVATIFDWRSGKVRSTTPIPARAPTSARLLPSGSFVIGGFVSDSTPSIFARHLPAAGTPIWQVDGVGAPETISDAGALFRSSLAPRRAIDRIDLSTGAQATVGEFPEHLRDPGAVRYLIGEATDESRVVWSEDDCYWSLVLAKPLAQEVSRPSINECPAIFDDESIVLDGRELSFLATAERGFRATTFDVRWRNKYFDPDLENMPPGTHRLRLKLTAYEAGLIRRHPQVPVRLRMTRWGLADVAASGVPRIRR